MTRDALIARGRRAAEIGMRDTCTIRRRVGETTDKDTGAVTATWSALYSGKCRIQQPQPIARPQDVGEDFLLIAQLEIQLPVVGTEGLVVADEITIATSVDLDLVGRVFLVHSLPPQDRRHRAPGRRHRAHRMSGLVNVHVTGLHELAQALDQAAADINEEVRKVTARGALNVKQDWQQRWKGLAHAPALPPRHQLRRDRARQHHHRRDRTRQGQAARRTRQPRRVRLDPQRTTTRRRTSPRGRGPALSAAARGPRYPPHGEVTKRDDYSA